MPKAGTVHKTRRENNNARLREADRGRQLMDRTPGSYRGREIPLEAVGGIVQ
jgi:hypothetical protein